MRPWQADSAKRAHGFKSEAGQEVEPTSQSHTEEKHGKFTESPNIRTGG